MIVQGTSWNNQGCCELFHQTDAQMNKLFPQRYFKEYFCISYVLGTILNAVELLGVKGNLRGSRVGVQDEGGYERRAV